MGRFLAGAACAFAAVNMPALAAEVEAPDEPTIVVTGQLEREASIGKIDAPIKETPATINVVDRELLDLRQPRTFVEALRGVPGVTQRSFRISTQNNLSRGFALRQSGSELRNGLRHYESSNLAPEMTNVERFEILKGPGSVLYGTGGLGGLFNVVTKRPMAEAAYMIEAGAGSYNFYRGALDINMPLNSDGSLAARLNAHRETSESYIDEVDIDTLLIAPALSWKPSDRTSLVIDTEFLRGDFDTLPTGTLADGTVLPNPNATIKRSLASAEPGYNNSLREQVYLSYLFDHEFSDSVKFHQGLLYAFSNKNGGTGSDPTGFVGGFAGPRRFVTRTATLSDAEWNSISIDNNLGLKFATGPIRHELLIGVDYYKSHVEFVNQSASLPNLDLQNPVYFLTPTSAFTMSSSSVQKQEFFGLYAQETLIPHETLKIVLAGRFTTADTESINRLNPALSRRAKDKPFTPRVGLVWTPIAPVSFFASYAESFNPLTGLDFAGNPFEPETGVSYESGVKFELFDRRISATIAVFDMKRQNVLTTDVDHAGFSIQTGEQTSKGLEAEINGDVLPGWRVTASYAYLERPLPRTIPWWSGSRCKAFPNTLSACSPITSSRTVRYKASASTARFIMKAASGANS